MSGVETRETLESNLEALTLNLASHASRRIKPMGWKMLTVVSSKTEVQNFQSLFYDRLVSGKTETIEVKVGHMGGVERAEVRYLPDHDIWYLYKYLKGNRHWNAFGLGRPANGTNVSITAEVNFPISGVVRSVGGLFAKATGQSVFILHRGKIGGGKKGVGKKLFEDNYRGKWREIYDGELYSQCALIGDLRATRLISQVSMFVREVDRIKGEVNNLVRKESVSDTSEFEPEFSGKKLVRGRGELVADCDHGIIVNNLAFRLKELGFSVGNDKYRDLYISIGGKKISTLFEVKTASSTNDVYGAIGQLYYHSARTLENTKRVAVLPSETSVEVQRTLTKLGIAIVLFEWSNQVPRFIGLEKAIE